MGRYKIEKSTEFQELCELYRGVFGKNVPYEIIGYKPIDEIMDYIVAEIVKERNRKYNK